MPGVVDSLHASSIKLSKSWYYSGFIERHGFSIKRSNNLKKCDSNAHKPAIIQFHQQLWEQHETKPIPPSSLFNFDQVPLPFVCEDDKRTLDDKGSERVRVRQFGRAQGSSVPVGDFAAGQVDVFPTECYRPRATR